MAQTETMILNMGPQHPSTHGVLRLELELDGETVVKATPHIGYLHTGFEKNMEYKTYHQCIPYTDRMDYLSTVSNNLAFTMAVEKLLGLEVPPRAECVRVIWAELNRIGSHLVWLATQALELGAATPFLYAFSEREKILDLFEMASGVRMMTSYNRIGGLMADLPAGWSEKLVEFLREFPAKVDEYETLLTNNPIWLRRTKGVGVLSGADALKYSLSGPNLRASGVNWDIRKSSPYLLYDQFDFRVPVGEVGDTFDRYIVRILEMRESVRIINQALKVLPTGPVRTDNPKVVFPEKERIKSSMEDLIHHFKLATEGFSPPAGEVYFSVEGPRGEMGYYIVSNGSNMPWRVRVRPPSFLNVQAIPFLIEGKMIPDVIAIVGSMDFVLGEVDR